MSEFGQVWQYAGIIVMVLGHKGRSWLMLCLNDPPGGNLYLGEQLRSGTYFETPTSWPVWEKVE